MNRADREAWQSARTLKDLGDLTALWIEGKIGEQPGYCGPSDLDDPERLVPLFAALCRAGFMTTQSQHAFAGPGRGGVLWEQRAAVEGFASVHVADLLRRAGEQAGLAVIAHDPAKRPRWKISYRHAVPVTRRAGLEYTGFGAHLSRRFIHDPHTGYGICRPDAIAALCNSWQVTVIDPEWGRPDLLWDVLAGTLTTGTQGK